MQTRLRNYKHEILSWEHNLMNLGMHNPGRYSGYDTMVASSASVFNIAHTGTGIKFKDQINALKGPVGVSLSGQGVIVMEDEPIGPFEFFSNVGNGETRFDLIVLKHSFVNIAGGQDAVYDIIKGPTNSPVKPIPVDPYHDIPIGLIEVPPGVSDINNCIWHKAKSPDSGDGEDARLNTPNIFKAMQLFHQSLTVLSTPTFTIAGPDPAHLWELNNDGNTFEILPVQAYNLDAIKLHSVPLQQGIELTIAINQNVTLRNLLGTAPPNPFDNKGYRTFVLHPNFFNNTVGSMGIYTPTSAGTEFVKVQFYKNQWIVLDIQGTTASTAIRGDLKMWYGDVPANTNATGLGINKLRGWAVCNGVNGTPDLRGRMPIMATEGIPAQGAGALDLAVVYNNTYGDAYGSHSKKILQGNIPSYYLPIHQVEHDHVITGSTNQNLGGAGYVPATGMILPEPAGRTSPSLISLFVHSGGTNDDFGVLNPVFSTVILMKL